MGKASALATLCESVEFRQYIVSLLSKNPLVFQSPLYIGKTDDLRSRTHQHLSGESGLKERLADAQVDLRRCVLVWTPMPQVPGLSSDETSVNLVVEELLSKLFVPPFTLRYG